MPDSFLERYVTFSHAPTRSMSKPYRGVAEWDANRAVYMVFVDNGTGHRELTFEVWHDGRGFLERDMRHRRAAQLANGGKPFKERLSDD